jgi:pentatricopeptide repeat protein
MEEAHACFASMSSKYKIRPSMEHYTIMVDLLGRSGKLDEAFQLIMQMPMQPHASVWGALLLACELHNNAELGEVVASKCFELAPGDSGYYILLGNIYAQANKWDKVKRLRKTMTERGLSKMPGSSWVQAA